MLRAKLIAPSNDEIYTFKADSNVIFVQSNAFVNDEEEGHCSQHKYYANGCPDCEAHQYIKTFDSQEIEKGIRTSPPNGGPIEKTYQTALEIQIGNPNPKFQLVRQQLARGMALFFSKQKVKAAKSALDKAEEIIKALTKEQKRAIAIAAYTAIEWDAIITEIYPDLMAAWQMGAIEGFNQFLGSYDPMQGLPKGLDGTDYALNRAAEMTGQAIIGEKLVPSSSAKFTITKATKEDLIDVIEQSFDKAETLEQMKQRIMTAAIFSDTRSQLIAKNEVSMAQVSGHLAAWKYTGNISRVGIRLSDTHVVEDECDELTKLDYDINNVPLIPAHPNCQCTIYALSENL